MTTDFYKNLLESISDGIYFVDLERRITFWNRGAEQITGFEAHEVLGTFCSDNMLVHVDEQGRELCKGHCPLDYVTRTGRTAQASIFLHHKNGQRTQVQVTASPITDNEGKIVGVVELFRETSPSRQDDELMEELRKAALIDPLTGIANRRSLDMKLKTAQEELRRYGIRFGVLLGDIDFFKGVNDGHGHAAGDEVLAMVARTLSGNVRACDLVGRWGGEEFLAIITHVTPDTLPRVAEKLRMLVETSFLQRESGTLRVTMSFGAALGAPEEETEELVARADRLLYGAKAAGRNCIFCEERQP